ncbi:MAG: hypothetical protein K9G48_13365 [Reyranella sp.]|nr:hypothetical protein [Reyranella sp.]
MRHVVILLCCIALAACGTPSRPFSHSASDDAAFRPNNDKVELAIGAPRNMPSDMGARLAAALAVELQSYGVVAAVQPADAPIQVAGAMSTRDAGEGIEVRIDWRIEGKPTTQEPAVSRTRTRAEDYAEASDRLISRIAQQAAPRIATLIGRPPTFQPRSPGQIAAGVSVPLEQPVDPADPASAVPGATPAASASRAPQVKVMVAAITGAPSDGNRQLYSGMRRALGSNKIVIVDTAGNDTFTVAGTVSLTPIDERTGKLVLKWVLKDPAGKNVGDIEQSNPVPLAAARGSWAGFGDIVASAAAEGVLELLEKALNQPR